MIIFILFLIKDLGRYISPILQKQSGNYLSYSGIYYSILNVLNKLYYKNSALSSFVLIVQKLPTILNFVFLIIFSEILVSKSASL